MSTTFAIIFLLKSTIAICVATPFTDLLLIKRGIADSILETIGNLTNRILDTNSAIVSRIPGLGEIAPNGTFLGVQYTPLVSSIVTQLEGFVDSITRALGGSKLNSTIAG